MGHNISVYLIKKSDIRDKVISSVLDNDHSIDNIPLTYLGSDIYATPSIPDIRKFGKGKTIALIKTDYFGGSGHQSAKLFIDGLLSYKCDSINRVLKDMGVNKNPSMDEFDTINLSKYRSNSDFKIKINK